ncbi:MAG: prepilin peptidase [Nitrospirae bacterium]|nr:prepilin peptidase [Nitrospirota bacterium]
MTTYIIVFIFGAIIGSFLNVCIYRIPKGLSIIKPSSYCPSCEKPIRFYDNIPIISYIGLRGRCRSCGSKVSINYLFVEFINAILYVAVVWKFGDYFLPYMLGYFLFVSSLIVITFIDFEYQIIPDRITLPGILISLILGSTVLPDPFFRSELLGFKPSLIGILAGGGVFYLVAVLGKAAFKKEAMGGGDIKMMAMVGGFLGWKGVLLTTFLGSLLGSIVGIILIAVKGKGFGSKIPFGPYLAIGSVLSLFFGQEFLMWYIYAR